MTQMKHFLSFLAIGCLLFIFGKTAFSESRTTIILGCETSVLTAPVWVAESKGYFSDHHLDVRIKSFESGKASLESMLTNHDVDICTVAQTPIMFSSFIRDDFGILSAMVTSTRDLKLIGDKRQGIFTPKDLVGKTVGVTKGSTSQFFLNACLINLLINPSLVKERNYSPTKLPHALLNKDVCAICIWEPHALTAKELMGPNAIVLSSSDVYREDFYFVTTQAFKNEKRKSLEAFLSAILQAQQFIAKNSSQTMDIVSKRLNFKREVIEKIWQEYRFELMLDQSIIVTLEDEAKWAIASKLVDHTRVPNYLKYIYAEPMKQVFPENVEIISK